MSALFGLKELNTNFCQFGQDDGKFSPFIHSVRNRDFPIVRLDNPVCYREPQASTAKSFRLLPVDPVKPLEDMRDLILWNTDPCIAYQYFDKWVFFPGFYRYTAPTGSIFHAIINNI